MGGVDDSVPGNTGAPDSARSADVYSWLRSAEPGADEAEALTVEVFRRLRRGLPSWLLAKPLDVRLCFYTVQVILERRGLLPSCTDLPPRPDVPGPA